MMMDCKRFGSGCDLIELLSRNSLRGTEKSHKNLSQDTQCPGRDSNRASPEYKFRALPLKQSAR
jgi:hypothetical protein